MAKDTIKRIEERLNAASLTDDDKQAISGLLNELREELDTVPAEQEDQARSVAGFTELGAHEATKSAPNAGALDSAVSGMRQSVHEFEQSHPKLVQVVNSIATALSNIGL